MCVIRHVMPAVLPSSAPNLPCPVATSTVLPVYPTYGNVWVATSPAPFVGNYPTITCSIAKYANVSARTHGKPVAMRQNSKVKNHYNAPYNIQANNQKKTIYKIFVFCINSRYARSSITISPTFSTLASAPFSTCSWCSTGAPI